MSHAYLGIFILKERIRCLSEMKIELDILHFYGLVLGLFEASWSSATEQASISRVEDKGGGTDTRVRGLRLPPGAGTLSEAARLGPGPGRGRGRKDLAPSFLLLSLPAAWAKEPGQCSLQGSALRDRVDKGPVSALPISSCLSKIYQTSSTIS